LSWFLEPKRIAKIDLQGIHVSGDKPSKELLLHQALYETRVRCGAIVHLHSTYATALSCLPDLDPVDCIPPLTPYVVMRVGKVRLLPYAPPGDLSIGGKIRDLQGQYAGVLLRNHGPVVAAQDLESAVYAAEELEETAKLILLLRRESPTYLTDVDVKELNLRFPKR
jgi:ribulose-5-phosphate 4-epimerase/fuculose-1-phosphate aldolase